MTLLRANDKVGVCHQPFRKTRLIQYFGLKIIHNINVKPDVKGIKWEARCKKWNTETQACTDEQMEMCKRHWRRLECWTDIATSAARDTRTSPAPCFSFPQRGREQECVLRDGEPKYSASISLVQKDAHTPARTQYQSPLRHPQCLSVSLISRQACDLRWPPLFLNWSQKLYSIKVLFNSVK